ncbi:MAG: HD domain-containing protein [Saprospiraceae bacterium]
MNKKKIINDPVYGFISIPYDIIYDLLEHPYFQRLRRIKQLGLTHYVYPGALHTRFHHALGAMHLMQKAIQTLQYKGVIITPEEAEAATIAILLHDIGHGPFSHALEHSIVNVHHEDLSILFMEQLNEEFNGALEMAISIFKNEYPKKYLHQLISSQLDMDRMDYLNRDSFFTGVSEGVIGYDRIIKMLNVYNGEIVVEYKGIYSIEKFLIARRIMYWQVYLHKTVVSAEQMLIRFFKRIKYLFEKNSLFEIPDSLLFFLEKPLNVTNFKAHKKTFLDKFAALDDIDITFLLKMSVNHKDFVLSTLAKNLLNRNLFKIDMQNSKFSGDHLDAVRLNIRNQFKEIDDKNLEWLIIEGSESNRAYSNKKDEIKFWMKNNQIKGLVDAFDHVIDSKYLTKYFLCYPKIF